MFAEFAGFADYNANHDYEIFETLYTGTTLSNDTYMLGCLPDLKIPKYLTDMQTQVNGYRESISQFIHSYAKTTELKTSLKPYFKLVVKGLLLLVKYRSTLPNGTYVLKADLSELVKQLERREITEHTARDQLNNEEKACLNREIGFSVFTIFGKGSEANRCINCGEDKTVIVNVKLQIKNLTKTYGNSLGSNKDIIFILRGKIFHEKH